MTPIIFIRDRLIGTTERVSIAYDGSEMDSSKSLSFQRGLSADGVIVAFTSQATNLVPLDNNNNRIDVFTRDRLNETTERVSITSDGLEVDKGGGAATISADGRYIVFGSMANNLVENDTNNFGDIFVHDRVTGQTTRVSVASDGTQGNDVSAPWANISRHGRFIAFGSYATNLVPDDNNGVEDIFVHDILTRVTVRVSVAYDGAEANDISKVPWISTDGKYIVFASAATNLVPNDTNAYQDIFVVPNPLF